MMYIACPYCGPRSEEEFVWGGPAHLVRPGPAEAVSDAEWTEYLHMRANTKGGDAERWCHVHGCGQWFNVVRSSVTHEITATYRMAEEPPAGVENG